MNAEITINKNMVPFDDKSPFITSGIRFGTSAITTRGLKENDMERIADLIDSVIANPNDDKMIKSIHSEINEWMSDKPLFAY